MLAVSKAKVAWTGGVNATTATRLYKLSLTDPTPTNPQNSFVDVAGSARSPTLYCGNSSTSCTPCSDAVLSQKCASGCYPTQRAVRETGCAFHCEVDFQER